jgi:hypothetical protein
LFSSSSFMVWSKLNNKSAILNCQKFILIAGYAAFWLANFLSIARQVAYGGARRCNLSRSIAKSRSRSNFPCNFLLHCKLQTRGVRRCNLLCNLKRKPLHCRLQEKLHRVTWP